jgi:hypothetical protein
MPEDTPPDDGGQVDPLGEATAVFFIGQDRGGQGQPTPGQHSHETLVSQRTDEAIERHGGDMPNDGAEFQTEPPMRRQEGIASHLRAHRAIAQDEVGQNREHCVTRGALEPPDGETTQTNADIMGVAGQAPTAATRGLVCELKADGQDEGQHTFEKRLPIAQELQVGRFVLKIDGDGPIGAWLFGCVTHVPPRLLGLCYAGHNRGATPKHFKTTGKDEGPSPLNSMECEADNSNNGYRQ